MRISRVRHWIIISFLLLPGLIQAADLPEVQLKKILNADNTALREIMGWIETDKETLRTSPAARDQLASRIRIRLHQVREQYEDFIKEHPGHARARVAYGSFLTNIDDRKAARTQWQLALKTDPDNAAALNNIATHIGNIALRNEITDQLPTAFRSIQQAMALAPKQPLYRHNFATLLNTFPKQAKAHFKLTSKQLTQRTLRELKTTMALAPEDFEIAADYAETHLDLKPLPRDRALNAWRHALKLAQLPEEKDWTHLQTAVVHLQTGHWNEADASLNRVRKGSHATLIGRIREALAIKRKQATTPKAP